MGVELRLMARRTWWTTVLCGVGACGKALPIGFDEEAPDGRIHAIVDAAREGDPASIAALIEQLDSDDPAVRLFAIRAIERISGRRFDYDYAGGVFEREAAVRAMMGELGAVAPAGPGALSEEREGSGVGAGSIGWAKDSGRGGEP